MEILSTTVDDAAGEAFDKGAKMLGLSYPGGPEIEKKSKHADSKKYIFSIPEVKTNKLSFSFSGLKTALLYKKKYLDENKIKYSINDLAASYQEILVDTLFSKLSRAVKQYEISTVSIVGGVSANKRFRFKSLDFEKKYNITIQFPEMEYCTDNAAMIAMAGYIKYKNKKISDIGIIPNPNISS